MLPENSSPEDSEQSAVDCEVYMVFGFKPHLLTLPFLSSYDSGDDDDTRYKCRDEREDGSNLAHDIKEQ